MEPLLVFAHQTISLDPLPIGSEDGIYDVALISPAGKSMLETRGEAKLHNFVEVLPVDVNLADLARGMYQLRTSPIADTMDFIFNLARVTGPKQCNASAATFLTSLEDICSSREKQPVYASRRFSKLRREFRSLVGSLRWYTDWVKMFGARSIVAIFLFVVAPRLSVGPPDTSGRHVTRSQTSRLA